MQILYADAGLAEVIGQILGHFLGQRRHQHALICFGPAVNLTHQVIDLTGDRSNLYHRIDQPGRPDDLLRHLRRRIEFISGGSRRHINDLLDPLFELFKLQWPVIQRRRQPETEIHQRLFA